MKTIGLVVNREKPLVLEIAKNMTDWLVERDITVYLAEKHSSDYDSGKVKCFEHQIATQLECLIVLGGDGTLLQTSRWASPYGIPLFGINFGQLGFLTEIEVNDIFPALNRLLAGEYRIEPRMMLEAQVVRNGGILETSIVLNDVVITKGAFARLISLETKLNNEVITSFWADGLIIATPTGSTAYSLSAGGPLVPPSLELMLYTPVCPHSLTSRPLIISPDNELRITINSHQGEVTLTLDGQHGVKLAQGDQVVVKRSSTKARLIKLGNRSFFNLLQMKLKEGTRDEI